MMQHIRFAIFGYLKQKPKIGINEGVKSCQTVRTYLIKITRTREAKSRRQRSLFSKKSCKSVQFIAQKWRN